MDMRRMFFSFIAGLLVAASSPSFADEITSSLQFPIDHNRTCRPDETPCLPWSAGLTTGHKELHPLFPVKTMRFVIPQNQILKSVKLETGPEQTIANYQPVLAPRQVPMSGASDSHRVTPAWSFHPFPAQPLEIRTHHFRGITTVEVKIYPLQVRRNETVYFKDATVHILTEPRRDTPELQRNLVRDYEEAAALADNGAQFSTPSTASDSPIGYLIIGPSALIGADGNSPLQPLINEKRSRGLTVSMATLESVSPSKDPAQIRAFIKSKYQQESIDYVLLIGDKSRLPWKYLSAGGADAESEPIPSDQYYACLDGTFDTPANYDWACEVAVGRIGAKTTQDVSNWVAKTLQLQQISKDARRNKKVINFAEKLDDSTLGSWVMEYLVSGRTGTPQTVGFPQSTAWSKAYDTFSQEVSAGEFVSMINGGDIHIVNHLGHSNDSYNMRLNSSDLGQFQGRPMFVFSQGCYPNDPDTDNFTIMAVRMAQHGPAAMISNTRYGWYEPGQEGEGSSAILHRIFWSTHFANGVRTIGAMNHKAKEIFIGTDQSSLAVYTALESNLIGDPELDLGN